MKIFGDVARGQILTLSERGSVYRGAESRFWAIARERERERESLCIQRVRKLGRLRIG